MVELESIDMAFRIYRWPGVIARTALVVLIALVAATAARAQAQSQAQSKPTLVAAAANMNIAMAAIAREFERTTGGKLGITYGASGNLTRQILQGAPFELFVSADEDTVFRLADAGAARDRGVLYAIGRLALYVPGNSRITLDGKLDGVRLDWASIDKFSIANPEHAPYGRAAREVLEALALWPLVRSKLVLGENVSQAAQYVLSGAAQVGLIPLSLALSEPLARTGRHIVIDERLHAPLRQRMVLMRKAGPVAESFYRYLQAPPARETLRRFGFGAPDA